MSARPSRYQRSINRRATVLSPFLRHLNTGTLAFVMFVAFALLSSIRGKESEIRDLASIRGAKTEIVIDNFTFFPNTISIAAGTTITWTNHDSVPHVVASADNQFKKSPVLKTGQRFSKAFAAAGTYSYFCSIHPRMTGKIVVK
jgi:plastocyanin